MTIITLDLPRLPSPVTLAGESDALLTAVTALCGGGFEGELRAKHLIEQAESCFEVEPGDAVLTE